MFYIKTPLKNMSQGARLEFIREFRNMDPNDTAEYMGYSGKTSNKSIREWENNKKSPDNTNLSELAKVYEVSLDAIKEYDFTDSIDEIYYQMWLEEQYPYYQFNIESSKFAGSAYNFNVQKVINEWLKMREKREKYEITDQEYIEWKLNFMNETIKLEISGTSKKDGFLIEHEV